MKNKIHLPALPMSLLAVVLFLITIPSLVVASGGSDLRSLSSFDKVDISGAYKVILVQGDKEQILVEAEDDILPKIITVVENGTLKIKHREKINSSGKIVLTITFKNISELDCSGAIDLTSGTSLKFNNLDLDLSGASKSDLDIAADKLDIDISGSGSASLKGKVKKVELDISGTGNYAASDLVTEEYAIDISGVGNATVNATTKLDVSISGTGAVNYKGDPEIKQDISGTGKLKKI